MKNVNTCFWSSAFYLHLLIGVSTYSFSLTTEAELWLFIFRLGLSGSFTGGIGGKGEYSGGKGEDSSSYT